MAQALPSDEVVTRRVLALHGRGVSPNDIARRQNMTRAQAVGILADHGIEVRDRGVRVQSIWSDDDEDEIRRRIRVKAAAGARRRLQEIAQGK